MKLFTKYNRINLLVTVLIFLLSTTAYSFLLRYVLIEFLNDNLKIEQHEIETYASKYDKLPEAIHVKERRISYAMSLNAATKRKFSTITVFDEEENRLEPYRQITFNVKANGQWFLVSVAISMEDIDDMIRLIILITIVTILLILVTGAIINRFVLKRLWTPFYNTIATIESYNIGNKTKIQFKQSNIDEFNLLNATLDQSLGKAENDYLLLKEFTANASHELQTPLAIVRCKLDLMIQEEGLSEDQGSALQGAYDAIQKMSKLNQSLLLLAKIENKQFEGATTINVRERLETKIEEFQELWRAKNLLVKENIEDCVIQLNPILLEIMLNNLLSNATKHNISNGLISISLSEKQMIIKNSSASPEIDRRFIFTRFYRGAATSDNGLGLFIAKQICDQNGFALDYQYSDAQHVFSLRF